MKSLFAPWLTWRRLFFIAAAGLFTVFAAVFKPGDAVDFLKRVQTAVENGLGSFDALKLANAFAYRIAGCRLESGGASWYVCDGRPFWSIYTLGREPAPGTLESYTRGTSSCRSFRCDCQPGPRESGFPATRLFLDSLSTAPCRTPIGAEGTCRWQCAERVTHVYVPHAILYPVFVPAHILWSVLSSLWTEGSTLGALLFTVLVLASAVLVAAAVNFDWDDNWYWSFAGLLILTPLTASLLALALKAFLVVLSGIFSGVIGLVIWLIAVVGGGIKAGAVVYGILQQAKTLDELTSVPPDGERKSEDGAGPEVQEGRQSRNTPPMT